MGPKLRSFYIDVEGVDVILGMAVAQRAATVEAQSMI